MKCKIIKWSLNKNETEFDKKKMKLKIAKEKRIERSEEVKKRKKKEKWIRDEILEERDTNRGGMMDERAVGLGDRDMIARGRGGPPVLFTSMINAVCIMKNKKIKKKFPHTRNFSYFRWKLVSKETSIPLIHFL